MGGALQSTLELRIEIDGHETATHAAQGLTTLEYAPKTLGRFTCMIREKCYRVLRNNMRNVKKFHKQKLRQK